MTPALAYIADRHACMAGVDGRYVPLAEQGYDTEELRYAFQAGLLDAMEAEDGEDPEPECAGFGSASL